MLSEHKKALLSGEDPPPFLVELDAKGDFRHIKKKEDLLPGGKLLVIDPGLPD
jgi:hypothetical protein